MSRALLQKKTVFNDPLPTTFQDPRLHLAAIVDSSDDAILSKDLNGVITSWNSAATRLFGYTPEEIIGKSVLTLIPAALHSEEPEILRKMRNGERLEHFETRRCRKNGEVIDISLTISPIYDREGQIVGISKIARDITDRKRTEAALIEADRLAAIGRMAATIAHEINNPLEAVMNLGYILSLSPFMDPELRGYAEQLMGEVTRISNITKQTLTFYRDTTQPVDTEVADILDNILKLHHRLIEGNGVCVTMDLEPGLQVRVRPGELRQVLTNLIVNSLDAMPEGGELSLRSTRAHDGNTVGISVADTGPGIPFANRDRIFHPFFSTKKHKGNGIGLWICQTIVHKYGGTLQMRTSDAGDIGRKTGTIFQLYLPAS